MKHANPLAMTICAVLALGAQGARADGEKIAVFTKNQTNPYFQSLRIGAETAARQMNASVSHYVPTKPDSIPEQMSQVEDAITKRPDAIVFVPVDIKAMVPAVTKMNTANIPVVNVTDKIESGKIVSYVGSDDYSLGVQTATYLLKKLGGEGNVVILEGVKGSIAGLERIRGFRKVLEDYPKVKLVAVQPANFQRLQGLQVMENLMQSHPKIDGVLAANDAMAMGAIEALDAAKRKALVVGVNGSREGIEAIKAGKLLASGDFDGFVQGCIGTTIAVRNLRKLPVPAQVVLPAAVIDASNYKGRDVSDSERSCPKWEEVAAK